MTVSPFVGISTSFWQPLAVILRISYILQSNSLPGSRIKTNITADHLSGVIGSGIKDQTCFDVTESDCLAGTDSKTHDMTAVSMDTRGNINSNNAAAACCRMVDGCDPVSVIAFNRSVKADTEDGIDDYIICAKIRSIADRH